MKMRARLRKLADWAVRFVAAMRTYLRIHTRGGTDYARWNNVANLHADWDSRTAGLAGLVPPGSSVLEFGAGRKTLQRYLPSGCTYTPSDLADRGDGTIIFDLNASELPSLRKHDVAVFSGVLEYVQDVPRVVELMARTVKMVVASYAPCESVPGVVDRRGQGWVNDYTVSQLEEIFIKQGFRIDAKGVWRDQKTWRFVRT